VDEVNSTQDEILYLLAQCQLSADPTNPQGELSDAILRMAEFGEAVRVLMLRLRIESIDSPHARESIDPTRPKIRFRGESQGGVPSEATVHGSVEVTDAGDIRWRLVSFSSWFMLNSQVCFGLQMLWYSD
jgi:hypothetical protein